MILNSLRIENFRNLKNIYLEPSKDINVIAGDNGVGKTNIIEAIYMLTGAKSFRMAKDKNLINFDEETAKIEGEINKGKNSFKISVLMDKKPLSYRKGFINEVENGRAARLAGNFCAVVFSPDHLGLVKGSREGRRYFMDNAICNLYPGHIDDLYRYNRVLEHRNKLLKKIKNDNKYDSELLDVIDLQMSEYCIKVSTRRQKYVEGLKVLAHQYYNEISNGKEKIDIAYESRAENEEDFLCLLKENRDNDIRMGFTGVGVHRDDLSIQISSLPAGNFASQGQQRSIVLSLKKAEAKYYKEITNYAPVLLFDDVLSELDQKRQEYLLSQTDNFQTFFTSCDKRLFEKLPVTVFNIKNGELI